MNDVATNICQALVTGCVGGDSGAIHVSDADFNADGVTIQGCSAKTRGGGVKVDGISTSTFPATTFVGNNATDGGAMALEGGSAVLLGTTFANNRVGA